MSARPYMFPSLLGMIVIFYTMYFLVIPHDFINEEYLSPLF